MIPSNPNLKLVTKELRSLMGQFLAPDNISDWAELEDYEYGGLALQDTTESLFYQVWKGYWTPSDDTAYVIPQESTGPAVAIFTQVGVTEFAFTFDQNMRWAAATRDSTNTLYFRWYDAVAAAYVLTTYPGVSSVRLTHDDKRVRSVIAGSSDMILTYIRADQLRWRIQRDRFLIEYTYPGLSLTARQRISHFGMNTKNRLQWRIGPRHLNI